MIPDSGPAKILPGQSTRHPWSFHAPAGAGQRRPNGSHYFCTITICHNTSDGMNFQQLIITLQQYWAERGCVIVQPLDMPVGAGTFHTSTFLSSIGPEPWHAAYVQPSRRPTDGRYGDNPNRLQHYYQFQVLLKPSPDDMQDQYLGSLAAL